MPKFNALSKPISISEKCNISINLPLTIWANVSVKLNIVRLNFILHSIAKQTVTHDAIA